MLYFSIQTVRPEREKQPRLRGGLRTDANGLGSCSERSRNGLGTVSDRPRIGTDVSAVFRKFLPDEPRVVADCGLSTKVLIESVMCCWIYPPLFPQRPCEELSAKGKRLVA